MWCILGWGGLSLGRGSVLSRVFLFACVVNERDQDGAIAQIVYPLPVFFCEALFAKELVYGLDVFGYLLVRSWPQSIENQVKLSLTNFWLEVFRVLTRVFV